MIAFLKAITTILTIVATSSTLSADWLKESIISNKNLNSANPCITSDNKGNIHAVWQAENNDAQDIYFSKYDGRWSPIDKITNEKGKSSAPIIISDIFNNLHMVWQHKFSANYSIYYGTFHKNFPVIEKSNAISPDIIADRTGNIHIVWQDLENGIYQIYYKKLDIEKGWEPDIKLTKGAASAANPKLTVDKYNNLHLVWRDNRDGNYEIYYKYLDGKGWSEDFRLTNDPSSSENPEIAVDNYLNVHVVWRDNRDKTYAIYYKKWDGKTWQNDQRLSDISNVSASATNPAVVADILGAIHVVWQDNRDGNYEIYYKKFDGKWSKDSRITNDKYNSHNPKIISDSAANLHLVWSNQENDVSYVYYKKFVSPRPLIKAVQDVKVNIDTGAAGQAEPTLSINTHGDIFICWADVRLGEFNSDIYAQVYNQDFTKRGDNFLINTDKKISTQGHPRVSIFSNDYFAVVWQDGRNENMDIYCQLFDAGCETKGDNFKINDDQTELDNDQPDIAGLKNKSALIVWRDQRSGQLEIYGQILGNGKNFKITDSACRGDRPVALTSWPAVSASEHGFYIVVWADNRGGNRNIYGQKVLMDGKLTGNNFKINENPTWNCNHPAVACNPDGGFLVTWWTNNSENAAVIYAQSFDENVKPISGNFLVGDNNTNDVKQIDPVVDIDLNGNSIIAWLDHRNGQDDPDVYAQRYDSKGINANYNFQISASQSPIEGIIQSEPCVKFQQNGNIVFTWVDHQMSNPDIFACRFEPVNMLPIADAGQDFISEVNTMVTLDGTGSRDPDGDPIVHFLWVQTGGRKITLENPQTSKPCFMPKSIGDQYTFKLIVNDGFVNSEPAFVNVTIQK